MKCIINGNIEKLKLDKNVLTIEGDIKVSDSYHDFDDLYAHRIILFLALMKFNKDVSWKSKKHSDENCYPGWFIAGMNLPNGDISYHIPEKFWTAIDDIKTLEKAPEYDGHSGDDVIRRLNNWIRDMGN